MISLQLFRLVMILSFFMKDGWLSQEMQKSLSRSPKHPYVQLLVESIPIPDPEQPWQGRVELPPEEELEMNTLRGCKFYRRCPYKMEMCLKSPPPLYNIGADHLAACYLYKGREVDEDA